MLHQRGRPLGTKISIPPALAISKRAEWLPARAISTITLEFITIFLVAFATSASYAVFILGVAVPVGFYAVCAFVLAASTILISLACRQYSSQERGRAIFLLDGMFALVFGFGALLSVLFLTKASQDYSRAIFLAQLAATSVATVGMRAFVFSFFRSASGRRLAKTCRTVLIGQETDRLAYCAKLEAAGSRIIASYDFPEYALSSNEIIDADARVILDASRALRADEVTILAQSTKLRETVELARVLSNVPLVVQVIPIDMIDVIPAARMVEVAGAMAIQVSHPPLTAFDQLLKRIADVIVAIAGLIVLAPLLLLTAIAIKLESPGPVLFRQVRHGYNYRPIVVYKFRSMRVEYCGESFVQAAINDPRVTRLGRLLRRFNIDELPQLLNVLQGNMSIVGPRPHATEHNREFEDIIPPFARRHNVKPGITGWAQVNGFRGPTDTLDKMQRRIEHDLYYIDNWSFLFDLQIMLLTLFSKKYYTNNV